MSLYSCQFCSFVLNAGSSLFNLKQHEDKCKGRPDDYDPEAEEAKRKKRLKSSLPVPTYFQRKTPAPTLAAPPDPEVVIVEAAAGPSMPPPSTGLSAVCRRLPMQSPLALPSDSSIKLGSCCGFRPALKGVFHLAWPFAAHGDVKLYRDSCNFDLDGLWSHQCQKIEDESGSQICKKCRELEHNTSVKALIARANEFDLSTGAMSRTRNLYLGFQQLQERVVTYRAERGDIRLDLLNKRRKVRPYKPHTRLMMPLNIPLILACLRSTFKRGGWTIMIACLKPWQQKRSHVYVPSSRSH